MKALQCFQFVYYKYCRIVKVNICFHPNNPYEYIYFQLSNPRNRFLLTPHLIHLFVLFILDIISLPFEELNNFMFCSWMTFTFVPTSIYLVILYSLNFGIHIFIDKLGILPLNVIISHFTTSRCFIFRCDNDKRKSKPCGYPLIHVILDSRYLPLPSYVIGPTMLDLEQLCLINIFSIFLKNLFLDKNSFLVCFTNTQAGTVIKKIPQIFCCNTCTGMVWSQSIHDPLTLIEIAIRTYVLIFRILSKFKYSSICTYRLRSLTKICFLNDYTCNNNLSLNWLVVQSVFTNNALI